MRHFRIAVGFKSYYKVRSTFCKSSLCHTPSHIQIIWHNASESPCLPLPFLVKIKWHWRIYCTKLHKMKCFASFHLGWETCITGLDCLDFYCRVAVYFPFCYICTNRTSVHFQTHMVKCFSDWFRSFLYLLRYILQFIISIFRFWWIMSTLLKR